MVLVLTDEGNEDESEEEEEELEESLDDSFKLYSGAAEEEFIISRTSGRSAASLKHEDLIKKLAR